MNNSAAYNHHYRDLDLIELPAEHHEEVRRKRIERIKRDRAEREAAGIK